MPLNSILHPTSSILHPTSNILHPASYIQHPASCIQHPASCILHPTSYHIPKKCKALQFKDCTCMAEAFNVTNFSRTLIHVMLVFVISLDNWHVLELLWLLFVSYLFMIPINLPKEWNQQLEAYIWYMRCFERHPSSKNEKKINKMSHISFIHNSLYQEVKVIFLRRNRNQTDMIVYLFVKRYHIN